jgi:hypothetical protein
VYIDFEFTGDTIYSVHIGDIALYREVRTVINVKLHHDLPQKLTIFYHIGDSRASCPFFSEESWDFPPTN